MTSDESNRLNQGVFADDWGRPEYLVYKSRPASGRQMETKEVDAERMLHLKFVRRLHQMRGTSLLSGCADPPQCPERKYEDSELTAARIAAALGMYIRKGDGQSYETDGNDSKENERELPFSQALFTTI